MSAVRETGSEIPRPEETGDSGSGQNGCKQEEDCGLVGRTSKTEVIRICEDGKVDVGQVTYRGFRLGLTRGFECRFEVDEHPVPANVN